MQYTRIKSFKKKFFRVAVSEDDLVRFAKKIANASSSEDKQISIRIETSDKKEVITCRDPEFFRSDEMPGQIRSASITYYHYNEPIECRLSFETGTSGSVGLSVEGSDPQVPGLFQDLENAIKEKRLFGYALVDITDRFWFALVLPICVAALIYLIFDLWLDLWKELVPEFGGSNTHLVISGVGWISILLTIMSGALWAETLTKKLLTPVQFTGRISDPNTKSRKRILLLITLFLLPLVVGLITSATYEIFNWWLAIN